MAGINLSQSMQENKQSNKKKTLLDMGLVGSFVVFLITVGIWGGLEWYTKSINDKIAAMDATIAENSGKLSGKDADKAADFADRIKIISQSSEPIEPQVLLTELESVMVPEIVLKKYDFNKEEQYIIVAGVTDNFKYLAQQIMALKTKDTFSDIKVSTINRTKEGQISFELKTVLASGVK